MTTLTVRRIKDHFVVTGPDIEPMQFKSRPEARDWCRSHYPGHPALVWLAVYRKDERKARLIMRAFLFLS